ncbi:MAG: RsmE family RNA methyltransferase [Candidatus Dormibacteria bacterium]
MLVEPGRRPLLYLDEVPAGPFSLGRDHARHFGLALRLRAGDRVEAALPDGRVKLLELVRVDRSGVVVLAIGDVEQEREAARPVIVALGLLKSGKFDDLLPQLVELGAVRVIPVEAARSVQRLAGREIDRRLERWRAVAREAAMLARRPLVPAIEPPGSLRAALGSCSDATRLFLWEEGSHPPLSELVPGSAGAVALFIGPEGGWDESEAGLATAEGAQLASLGPRILRVETAAVAAVAVVRAADRDM